MQFRSAKHATDGGTSRRFLDRFHTPRTSSKRRRAPVLEMLEGRTLLSISASPWTGSGQVQFVGTGTGGTLVLYQTTIGGQPGFGYSLDGGTTTFTSIDTHSLLASTVASFKVDFSADPNSTLSIANVTADPWTFGMSVTLIGDSTTLQTPGLGAGTTWTLTQDSGTLASTGTVNSPIPTLHPISFSGVENLSPDSTMTTTNTLIGEGASTTASPTWTLGTTANKGIYSDGNNTANFSGFGVLTDPTGVTDATLTGESNATSTWTLTSANDGTYGDGTFNVSFNNIENLIGSTGLTATNNLIGEAGATSTWALGNSANDGTYADSNLSTPTSVNFTGFDTLTAGAGATDTLVGESGATSTWTLTSSANDGTYADSNSTPTSVTFHNFAYLTAGSGATDTLVGQSSVNTTWALSDPANDGLYTGSSSTSVTFTGFDTLQGGTDTSTTNTLVGESDAYSYWTLGSTYSYAGNGTVSFSSFNALTGGNGGNEFDVNTTFPGSLTGGSGGAGYSDIFYLNPGGSVSSGIVGATDNSMIDYSTEVNVTLNGHNGIGYNGSETTNVSGGFTGINAVNATTGGMLFGDSTTSTTSTWDLAPSTYQDGGAYNALTFLGFGTLVGGEGADTFDIDASSPLRLNLEGGNTSSSTDFFDFTGSGTAGTLNGTINGEAGTSTLNYSAYTSAATVSLGTGTSTGTLGISNIDDAGSSTAYNLVGGSSTTLVGPNTVTTWDISGPNSGSLLLGLKTFSFSSVPNLSGGVRANTFDLASGGSVTGAITGGSTNDTLNLFGPSDVTYTTQVTVNVTGNNAGSVNLTSDASLLLNFSRIANVTGTAGNDKFVLTDGKGLTGYLHGGGGADNTLNYSAYTTSVRVNLSPLSSKVATNIDGGVSGIETVIGGHGNDILIGNSGGNTTLEDSANGNDILVGLGGGNSLTVSGTGRNILIGGSGASNTLDSSTATGENLLIAGKVTFNGSQTNLAALDSLMAEWSRAGVPFLTRIAHLKGTQAGGLNGIYKLTTTTVTADGGGSTLTGNSSGGDTWFIAPTTDTVASKTGDVVDTF